MITAGRTIVIVAATALACGGEPAPPPGAPPASRARPAPAGARPRARLDIALDSDATWVAFRSPTSLLVGKDELGSARGIAEYDAATGKLLGQVVAAGGGRAALAPRAGLLAYAADTTVTVLRLADRSTVRAFGDLWASSVALSPDGRLLAVSYAQPEDAPDIQLFDIASGKRVASMAPRGGDALPYDSGFRLQVAFSSDGRRLAALLANDTPAEAELSVWSVPGAKREAAWPLSRSGEDEIGSAPRLGAALAIAPDGSAVAAGDIDSAAHVFPILGGKERLLPRRGRAITAIAFSPTGSLVAAAGENGPLALWSLPDGREIAMLPAPDRCSALAFSPDGARVAAACARAVAIWQVPR
ncbi:MAG TPA: hypothetical protein VKB80_01210 [Kofleriaceae bacterium]|nr:hypothetical protein [Kofleriaceae bacterium]